MMQPRILEGVKVLDLTRLIAGPWCTQSLADMGATVYKIERPGAGDDMRQSPPFLRAPDGSKTRDTPSYLCVNRGKRSLALDISQPRGQALVRALAQRCDVFIENYKAGDLKRHGLDYESIRAIKPDIVYCSITGFGQDGPYAAAPGYDPIFQAISGIMSTCGHPDDQPGGGPMRATVPFVDVMGGITATAAVLGALYHRKAGGKGQFIDLALLDVAIAAMAHQAQNYLSTGAVQGRVGNGSPLFGPSGVYPCKDGGQVFIQVGNDGQWKRFCECLQRGDWLADPALASNAQRMARAEELDAEVKRVTQQWAAHELADMLSEAGIPCGAVNSIAQAQEHPQVRHRKLRMQVPHPVHGHIEQVRSPYRFSETPLAFRAPPEFGGDTRQVLGTELGLTDGELADLEAAGVLAAGVHAP